MKMMKKNYQFMMKKYIYMHKLQDKLIVKIEKKEYIGKKNISSSSWILRYITFETCAKQFLEPSYWEKLRSLNVNTLIRISKSTCSPKTKGEEQYEVSAKRIKNPIFVACCQRYRCKGLLSLCSRNYHYRQVRKESKRVGRRKSFLAGSYEFLALVQFLGLSHASIHHSFPPFLY